MVAVDSALLLLSQSAKHWAKASPPGRGKNSPAAGLVKASSMRFTQTMPSAFEMHGVLMIGREWMRALVLAALVICTVSNDAMARTYTTDFALTEDPISEGGNWINGLVVGLDWRNCATAGK